MEAMQYAELYDDRELEELDDRWARAWKHRPLPQHDAEILRHIRRRTKRYTPPTFERD